MLIFILIFWDLLIIIPQILEWRDFSHKISEFLIKFISKIKLENINSIFHLIFTFVKSLELTNFWLINRAKKPYVLTTLMVLTLFYSTHTKILIRNKSISPQRETSALFRHFPTNEFTFWGIGFIFSPVHCGYFFSRLIRYNAVFKQWLLLSPCLNCLRKEISFIHSK